MKMIIEVTEREAETILESLMQEPYGKVAALVPKLVEQLKRQSMPPAPPETDLDRDQPTTDNPDPEETND